MDRFQRARSDDALSIEIGKAGWHRSYDRIKSTAAATAALKLPSLTARRTACLDIFPFLIASARLIAVLIKVPETKPLFVERTGGGVCLK